MDTGDAEHKGYHPAADMISGILDITIVKPVLECILGKDLITGEYLTEYDIRWKQAGIIIDFVTLGGGSKLIKGGMSLKEFLKASGKTLTVDALAATATYGTAYVGEELGLSEEAILVLSTLAGVGTSYAAGKAIFKEAGVVVETSYGKSSGNLNWDAIVSKKGETRVDHINRHAVPNNSRETHGVFNGNPIDMVNDAWEQRHLVEPISDGMGGTIYNIPYKNAGYESGFINTGAQMDYITIVTMDESADLITAFPSFGDYHK